MVDAVPPGGGAVDTLETPQPDTTSAAKAETMAVVTAYTTPADTTLAEDGSAAGAMAVEEGVGETVAVVAGEMVAEGFDPSGKQVYQLKVLELRRERGG